MDKPTPAIRILTAEELRDRRNQPRDRSDKTGKRGKYAGLVLSNRDFRGMCFQEADFRGSDLSRANLQYCDLTGADLRGARLDGVDLSEASLNGANLSDAKLTDANLKGCALSGAVLARTRLGGARLDGATCHDVHAPGAWFEEATLIGAKFNRAFLEAANLRKVDATGADFGHSLVLRSVLDGADFSEAKLGGAYLSGSTMKGCTLVGATGVEFDENAIEGIRVSARTTSRWLELRRAYTMQKLVVVGLLTAAFFAPLMLKVLFFAGVGELQDRAIGAVSEETVEQLREIAAGESVATEAAPAPTALEQAAARWVIETGVERAGMEQKLVAAVATGFADDWLTGATSCLLILFNLLRIHVHRNVMDMRQNEIDERTSPPRALYDHVENDARRFIPSLWQLHRALSWVGKVALVLSAAVWLRMFFTTSVWVP